MREVFIPKKRIQLKSTDFESIDEYRTLFSGKKNLYVSVYEYEDIVSPNHVIVDKIFLDFDYDKDGKFFRDVRTVVQFLADSQYIFCIRFSGRGFHIFIKLNDDIKLKHPKQAIKKWVRNMHQNTDTDSDHAVIGDLRRVSRMIGSMNLKTHLYCIPISYSELMHYSYEKICEIAKECNENMEDIFYYGERFLDISDFDVNNEYESQPLNIDTNINKIKGWEVPPPCINKMMSDPELGYWERGQLILYLRDWGFSFDEIMSILKASLSEQKYYHCTIEENQVAYLYYDREDLLFASCQTLNDNGFCSPNKCTGCHLYL